MRLRQEQLYTCRREFQIMNIILAGMPGSGKTTVSAILGEMLGKEVADTDGEIIKVHGDISSIFAKYGEKRFRDIETQTVEELSSRDGLIISTGGGCLMRAENVKLLKSNGRIVYLRASVGTLFGRLKDDKTRPLLKGDMLRNLEKLYEERASTYETAADIIIDTDNLGPRMVAVAVTEAIK